MIKGWENKRKVFIMIILDTKIFITNTQVVIFLSMRSRKVLIFECSICDITGYITTIGTEILFHFCEQAFETLEILHS